MSNTVNGLRSELQEHVVTINFTKKDGSTRKLVGTTQTSYLEQVEQLTPEQSIARESRDRKDVGDLVTVWDTENDGWRSFHYDQLIDSQISA